MIKSVDSLKNKIPGGSDMSTGKKTRRRKSGIHVVFQKPTYAAQEHWSESPEASLPK